LARCVWWLPKILTRGPDRPPACSSTIRPYVASRPPSRAGFVVWASNVSLLQVYQVIIDVSLFYSHFSFRSPACNEIYRVLVKLSIVSLVPSIAASVTPPCSIATVGVFSKVGVLGRKSFRGRIWLQALKTVCFKKHAFREF
jgi:hypothetical protein